MTRRYLAVAVVGLAMVAGACGGGKGEQTAGVASIDGNQAGSGSKSGDDKVDAEKAGLAYAKCLRANGVDVPDPDANGMFVITPDSPPPDQDAMAEADKACAAERKALQGSMGEPDKDFQDKALAMSRCMRERGIDMPDPSMSGNGGAAVEIDPDKVDTPEFKAAAEACRKQVGMPEPGAAVGGAR